MNPRHSRRGPRLGGLVPFIRTKIIHCACDCGSEGCRKTHFSNRRALSDGSTALRIHQRRKHRIIERYRIKCPLIPTEAPTHLRAVPLVSAQLRCPEAFTPRHHGPFFANAPRKDPPKQRKTVLCRASALNASEQIVVLPTPRNAVGYVQSNRYSLEVDAPVARAAIVQRPTILVINVATRRKKVE